METIYYSREKSQLSIRSTPKDGYSPLTWGPSILGSRIPFLASVVPYAKSVIIEEQMQLPKECALFADLPKLKSIEGLENLDTSQVVNMSHMFSGCRALRQIDLSSFDMTSVSDISCMFRGCSNLTEIGGLETWDTSNLHDLNGTFAGCSSLTTLDGITTWDTSHVTDMSETFFSAGIRSFDLSGWDVSRVSDAYAMFSECSNLVSLDLSGWDTSNITDMSHMFGGCRKLTAIVGLEGFDTTNVEYATGAFSLCSRIQRLDLSRWSMPSCIDMSEMFYGCRALVSLDMDNLEPVAGCNMAAMLAHDNKIETLRLCGWSPTLLRRLGLSNPPIAVDCQPPTLSNELASPAISSPPHPTNDTIERVAR